jgi:hypothetical protein
MERLYLEELEKHIIGNKLRVRVRPGAKQTEIVGFENGVLVVKLKSQPVKGKANEELVRFFKKEFNRRAKIVKGLKSREKVIIF